MWSQQPSPAQQVGPGDHQPQSSVMRGTTYSLAVSFNAVILLNYCFVEDLDSFGARPHREAAAEGAHGGAQPVCPAPRSGLSLTLGAQAKGSPSPSARTPHYTPPNPPKKLPNPKEPVQRASSRRGGHHPPRLERPQRSLSGRSRLGWEGCPGSPLQAADALRTPQPLSNPVLD